MNIPHLNTVQTESQSCESDVSSLRAYASNIISSWKNGKIADAKAVLHERPELESWQSIVLDLAYEEYCQRVDRGERIDVDAFCNQYPRYNSSLRRQIELHQLIQERPDILDGLGCGTWPEEWSDFLGYELLDELGRGAFSRVYRAREGALGSRTVVVKVSPFGGEEAETLGRLTHPNIVPVFSVGYDEKSENAAICMPYLGKATLHEVLNLLPTGPARLRQKSAIISDVATLINGAQEGGGPGADESRAFFQRNLSYTDAVIFMVSQLASALSHAHQRGIKHLDLKPSNVLVTSSGKPMLLDFNLSMDARRDTSRLGGTVPYMSPEQLDLMLTERHTVKEIDEKSDVYSLAVIAFEMLFGQRPFAVASERNWSKEDMRSLQRHQRAGVSVAHVNLPGRVGRSFLDVIVSCLEYRPAQRPAASELVRTLEELLRKRKRTRTFVRLGVPLLLGAVLVSTGSVGAVKLTAPGSMSQARAFARNGNFKLALIQTHEYVNRTGDPKAMPLLGYYCSVEGHHADAAHWYENAIARGIQSPEIYNNLGYSYFEMERYGRAESQLERAIAQRPQYVKALHVLAIVRYEASMKLGEVPLSAIKLVDKLLSSEGLNRQVYYDAALIYSYAASCDASYEDEAATIVQTAMEHGVSRTRLLAHPQVSPFLERSKGERAPTGDSHDIAEKPERAIHCYIEDLEQASDRFRRAQSGLAEPPSFR